MDGMIMEEFDDNDFIEDSRGASESPPPGEEADEAPDDDGATFNRPTNEEDSADGPFVPPALVDVLQDEVQRPIVARPPLRSQVRRRSHKY
jgi:hypothetical protein